MYLKLPSPQLCRKFFGLSTLAVSFLWVNPLQTKAQTNAYSIPKVFPTSPNSAAFTKYGDYPVSMFTGVPNISIPLYEIQAGEFKIPITLSYHASGIKVSELGSWAGLGWSVSAGGQINRKIVGLADESGQGYLTGNLKPTTATINPYNDTDLHYLDDIKGGRMDTQPDIFSYSYPGGGGKFFFDGTQAGYPARLIPFAPIKVYKTAGLGALSILDERGNTFNFGVAETTNYLENNSYTPKVSGWMLDRMISQNRRDTVSFSYSSALVSQPSGSSEVLVVNDASDGTDYHNNPEASHNITEGGGVEVYEQRLNTILFKNGKIVFVQSAANRQDATTKSLDNIQVYATDYATQTYKLLKTIKFYQGYFANGRMRLDSIGVFDNTGIKVQRYAFFYNNNTLLPGLTSKGLDYWGYYNGKDTQTSLIPKMDVGFDPGYGAPINSFYIGSNVDNGREPDARYMQACMLQRICYPTGGYTDFQYQANQYYDAGVLKLAGGLRVASIKSYDGVNPVPIVKTYQYADARPNFNIKNSFFYTTENCRYYKVTNSMAVTVTATQQRRTFVSSPNAEIESWDAVPVAYRTVTEYIGNGTTNIGKNVYRYSDYTDATSAASLAGKLVTNSFFFYRGQLQSKAVYAKNADGNYRIVERESMNYSAFPLTWYNGVGFVAGKRYTNEGYFTSDQCLDSQKAATPNDQNSYVYSYYGIPSDDNYLTGKTVTSYDTDTARYVSNTETYRYSNIKHQQITHKYRSDSKGNVRVTRLKYPADFIPSGGSNSGNVVIDSMLNHNMQTPVIEQWDSIKYVASSPLITSGVLNRYRGAAKNAIVADGVSKLSIVSPVAAYDSAKVVSGQLQGDSRYETLIKFDQYEPARNNLTQYTARNSGPVSIAWDYGNDLPVTETKNATTNLTAYTGFEADGKGGWSFSGSPVVNVNAPAGNRIYNLAAGAIASNTLPATKSYILRYWSNGAAAGISALGATAGATTLLRTFNNWNLYELQLPVGTTGVTITGSVSIDELKLFPKDAQQTTYNYSPLIGQTVITDAKGLPTNFEYDNFQRLLNIKDFQNNIVKNYSYNYKNTIVSGSPAIEYFNVSRSVPIRKNDCGDGYIGNYVTYVVPDLKYSSTISQQDADQQAMNEVSANGQAYANSNGTCTRIYYNVLAWRPFTKSNCGVGYTGSSETYTVLAGTFSSLISQEDADQKAQNDINVNGQGTVNHGGSCPNGTDVANWQIGYGITNPQGHTVDISITRPAGDINNENKVFYRIKMISGPDLTGYFYMPSGVNNYTTSASFSVSVTGNVVSISIDSIN